MNLLRAAALVCLAAASAHAAHADSLSAAGSSASSAGSASSGSLSDSIQGSSNSSNRAATPSAGDYRIEAIVAAAERPGLLRLELAHDDGRAFVLLLPQVTADAQRLVRGDTLRVSEQPYGLAFARAGHARPFFLALADGWRRDLAPRPVL